MFSQHSLRTTKGYRQEKRPYQSLYWKVYGKCISILNFVLCTLHDITREPLTFYLHSTSHNSNSFVDSYPELEMTLLPELQLFPTTILRLNELELECSILGNRNGIIKFKRKVCHFFHPGFFLQELLTL